jgi:hypothetical protein
MPRRRILDPEFWEDEKIGVVGYPVRLLFQALWNLADDAGLLEADAKRIRAFAFRYDRLSDATVARWLGKLEDMERVLAYEHRGRRYYVITRFHKHQTINRPTKSKLPRPPEELLERLTETDAKRVRERTETSSGNGAKPAEKMLLSDHGSVKTHGAFSDRSLSTHARSEVNRREEKRSADPKTSEDEVGEPSVPEGESQVDRLRRLERTTTDPSVRASLHLKLQRLGAAS